MNNFESMMAAYEQNSAAEIAKITDWTKAMFAKTNAKGAVVGMSGGIDCSLTARLLQAAGIPVLLVLMPYHNSMDLAQDNVDAMALIEKFNFDYLTHDITSAVDQVVNGLTSATLNSTSCSSSEITLNQMAINNIKPRMRMTCLYALAQSLDYLVVGTGNLSEATMGYFTKWGDGACDLNLIGSLTKTQVRILATALDIPMRIIKKAPSANLWAGQTDETEMGITYAALDQYILTQNAAPNEQQLIETAIAKNQHKRQPIPTYGK